MHGPKSRAIQIHLNSLNIQATRRLEFPPNTYVSNGSAKLLKYRMYIGNNQVKDKLSFIIHLPDSRSSEHEDPPQRCARDAEFPGRSETEDPRLKIAGVTCLGNLLRADESRLPPRGSRDAGPNYYIYELLKAFVGDSPFGRQAPHPALPAPQKAGLRTTAFNLPRAGKSPREVP